MLRWISNIAQRPLVGLGDVAGKDFVAVPDTEPEAELLKGQLTVLNDFIAAITTRKGEL